MRKAAIRVLFAASLFAAAGSGCTPAGEDPAAVAAEVERWRGTWHCLQRNQEGTLFPKEDVATIRLTMGGTLYHFEWGDDFDEFGRAKFFPSQSPKAMDVDIESPPEMAGRVIRLIYKFEGDRLILAHREDGERPRDFTAEPDSGQTVEVWARQRP